MLRNLTGYGVSISSSTLPRAIVVCVVGKRIIRATGLHVLAGHDVGSQGYGKSGVRPWDRR